MSSLEDSLPMKQLFHFYPMKVLLFLYEKVIIFEQVVIWVRHLVHRRGLLNHFTRKSKSFANLSEVEVGTVRIWRSKITHLTTGFGWKILKQIFVLFCFQSKMF